MHREPTATTEPAAKSGDFLRLAVAHLDRDLADHGEHLDVLIEQTHHAGQQAVCTALVEAHLQLDDARYQLGKALGLLI
jgi:hypothetical protein